MSGPKARDWKCKFCGKIFKGRRNLYEHFKICEEKLKLPHDKVGKVKIPGIGKKAVETRKQRILNGVQYKKHRKFTLEERKHLSEVRCKYLEEHPNHGLQWYEVNGIKVQGTWEKTFAEYLNKINIKWERKSLKYKNTHRYTPDFYCPDQDIYFEIKGFRRDRDLYKMYLVLKEYPNIKIKMIERKEIMNLDHIDIFNLPNFNEIYKFEDIDISKFIDLWK